MLLLSFALPLIQQIVQQQFFGDYDPPTLNDLSQQIISRKEAEAIAQFCKDFLPVGCIIR